MTVGYIILKGNYIIIITFCMCNWKNGGLYIITFKSWVSKYLFCKFSLFKYLFITVKKNLSNTSLKSSFRGWENISNTVPEEFCRKREIFWKFVPLKQYDVFKKFKILNCIVSYHYFFEMT